jgi:cobalt-zinc-cadmium efflux system outer membrane protein
MLQNYKNSGRGRSFKGASVASAVIFVLIAAAAAFSQQTVPAPTPSAAQQPTIKPASSEFITAGGLTVERLIELGGSRRADLQAARQRLAIAEGRLRQARLRPNPTLDAEYGSPRFLGGEAESDLSVGVSQVFELGGKRSKRAAVAELELQQVRAEVLALERQLAAEIRTAYTNAVAAARQLDVIERLIAADEEIVRVTEARLNEGDVAPLDVNLVKVELNRLKVQMIQTKSELETQTLQLKALTATDVAESLRLAPQADRPPRLELGLGELTELALKERADLQAARIGERLGSARINLARANAVPNIAGSVKYSRSTGITDLPASAGGGLAIDKDSELTFGVSIDIPVFNRNQGEIAAATGEQVQATRQREFLETTIRRDVAVAYRKYRAAAESLVLYSTQILPRAEENLRSVQAAYGYGDFSIFEVVSEQRRLTENITGYNQTLRDYYAALAELETALGTSLPPAALSSVNDSVLPDKNLVPNQINREEFLKNIEKVELPKRSILSDKDAKKQQEKE